MSEQDKKYSDFTDVHENLHLEIPGEHDLAQNQICFLIPKPSEYRFQCEDISSHWNPYSEGLVEETVGSPAESTVQL